MNLTIVVSNRDRLRLDDLSSQWFLKSIQWQDYKNFELLVSDGGSQNYKELEDYFDSFGGAVPMRIVQHKIGEPFERALLNNVGIRNAKSDYIMCTDVDMILDRRFVATLMQMVDNNVMVESRTMYWKTAIAEKIYKNEINPYNNIDACKVGRIKKRTTAGGCQCLHINAWHKVRGYDERYIGWGSEDYDLLTRVQMAGYKIRWMGENDDIMLFHQPHKKTAQQHARDLEYQEKNKKFLADIRNYGVNKNGWGGICE